MECFCPYCGFAIHIPEVTATLVLGLFGRVPGVVVIGFICDACGEKIKNSYRDEHGIGI